MLLEAGSSLTCGTAVMLDPTMSVTVVGPKGQVLAALGKKGVETTTAFLIFRYGSMHFVE